MAYFVFMGIDRAGMETTREQVRDAHRAYLKQDHGACRFVSGGPLLTKPDGAMCGSLLIFEAVDHADVARVVAGDPYAKAGLFERYELRALNWTVGAPEIGGGQ